MTKYQHTELPTQLLMKACRQYKGHGNVLSVYLTASREILQWEEGRDTLTKELSLRYIGEQLNMKFQNVWKALKTLVKDGYIKIIEIGKDKVGSIIQLIIPLVINPITKVTELVINPITNPENLVIKSITSTNNNYKNNNNNPPSSPKPVVSSYINNLQETAKAVVTSLFPSMQAGREGLSENLPSAAAQSSPRAQDTGQSQTRQAASLCQSEKREASPRTQEAGGVSISIEGVSEKFMALGIKALKDRGITKIERALGDIKSEMATRKMNSPENYFLGLCRKKEDFSGAVVEKKSEPCKALETSKQWEREQKKKTEPSEVLKSYMEKYPEETYRIMQEVDKTPIAKWVSLPEIKVSMYIGEFRKQYPDKA